MLEYISFTLEPDVYGLLNSALIESNRRVEEAAESVAESIMQGILNDIVSQFINKNDWYKMREKYIALTESNDKDIRTKFNVIDVKFYINSHKNIYYELAKPIVGRSHYIETTVNKFLKSFGNKVQYMFKHELVIYFLFINELDPFNSIRDIRQIIIEYILFTK